MKKSMNNCRCFMKNNLYILFYKNVKNAQYIGFAPENQKYVEENFTFFVILS